MRTISMLLLVVLPAILVAAEDDKTSFRIARVTDIARKTSVKVVSEEEYVALQEQMQVRNRLLPSAIQQAKKQWEADETNKRRIFLKSVVAEAKVTSLGIFKTKAEADAKAVPYQKALDEDSGKSDYLEAKLKSLQESLLTPPDDTPKVSQDVWIAKVKGEIKVTQESIAKRKTHDDEREKLEESIRSLIFEKLEKLLSPPAAAQKK